MEGGFVFVVSVEEVVGSVLVGVRSDRGVVGVWVEGV